MIIKSYSKINLSLKVNSKSRSGLHEIQSLYCLINSRASLIEPNLWYSSRDGVITIGHIFLRLKPNLLSRRRNAISEPWRSNVEASTTVVSSRSPNSSTFAGVQPMCLTRKSSTVTPKGKSPCVEQPPQTT